MTDDKTSKPKICINCAFYVAPPASQTWAYAKCIAPENNRNAAAARKALVTGETAEDYIPNWTYCDSARTDFGEAEVSCGVEGRWYKPKPAREWDGVGDK